MTPRIRQSIYYLGTVISGVIGIALLWGGLSAGVADHANQIVAGLVALLGGAAPAVAAKTVSKQISEGKFEAHSPADQVIEGINAVVAARSAAQAEIDRVKDAVTSVVQDVPVLGPLAKQALDALPDFN